MATPITIKDAIIGTSASGSILIINFGTPMEPISGDLYNDLFGGDIDTDLDIKHFQTVCKEPLKKEAVYKTDIQVSFHKCNHPLDPAEWDSEIDLINIREIKTN